VEHIITITTFVYLVPLITSILILLLLRSRQRPTHTTCAKCGYSRFGLAGSRCPECGHLHNTVPSTFRPIKYAMIAVAVLITIGPTLLASARYYELGARYISWFTPESSTGMIRPACLVALAVVLHLTLVASLMSRSKSMWLVGGLLCLAILIDGPIATQILIRTVMN